jgi:hypothetical protein
MDPNNQKMAMAVKLIKLPMDPNNQKMAMAVSMTGMKDMIQLSLMLSYFFSCVFL